MFKVCGSETLECPSLISYRTSNSTLVMFKKQFYLQGHMDVNLLNAHGAFVTTLWLESNFVVRESLE